MSYVNRFVAVALFITLSTSFSMAKSQHAKEAEAPLVASPLRNVIKQLRGTAVQIAYVIPPKTEVDADAMGSGFWIGPSYVATCWHVISRLPPSGQILVRTATDNVFGPRVFANANWVGFPATVVASDQIRDVAILRIEGRMMPGDYTAATGTAHFKVAQLRTSYPDVGTSTVLMGFPLGEPYMITQEGPVAAVAFNLPGPWNHQMRILVSTVANHGNSGGPVFDDEGKVMGLLEGALPSLPFPQLDAAVAVSGLAVVIPIQSLEVVAKNANISLGSN